MEDKELIAAKCVNLEQFIKSLPSDTPKANKAWDALRDLERLLEKTLDIHIIGKYSPY